MQVENRLSPAASAKLSRKRSRTNLLIGISLVVITALIYVVSIDHAQRETGAAVLQTISGG